MEMVLDALSWIFIVAGVVFCVIGGIGILRFKDVYEQMHAASLIDTLGIGFVFIGFMFQAGWTLVTAKLFLVLLFILVTSPTTTHALARAAINHDVMPNIDDEEQVKLVRQTQTFPVETEQ